MTLFEARVKFTLNKAKLVLWLFEQGYQVEEAQDGLKHMQGSLHYIGLADDLYLFKDINADGVPDYLKGTEEYKFAGDYWKSLDPSLCWGGDFTNKDGNHFSLGWGGRK